MKALHAAALALALVAAGCDQSDQPLPFSEQSPTTTKTVTPGTATTVATTAGAALTFPADAFSEPTTVTVAPLTVRTSSAFGGMASTTFAVTPEGAVLGSPAAAEVVLDSTADPARAWLATLTVSASGTVTPIAHTRVDLNAGLVSADIQKLGTLQVVIPSQDFVFPVQWSSASADRAPVSLDLLPLGGTDSVSVACGGLASPCAGLVVEASQNLRDKVQDAAAVYPTVQGTLRFANGRASGEVALHASIRVLLGSGATAENVDIDATLTPTAASVVTEDDSEITISNVHLVVTGADAQESGSQDEIATVTIPKTADGGTITISRSFQLTGTEAAWARVTFPVQFYP